MHPFIIDAKNPILLIDDNEDLVEVFVEQFEYQGYFVVAKTNYESAMKAIEEQNFSLILTDLNLGSFLAVPQIILAAKAKRSDQNIAIMSGADASQDSRIAPLLKKYPDIMIFQKPFQIDQIIQAFAA